MPATKRLPTRRGRSASQPTLAEQAYRGIREEILNLQLPQGTVVSERLLAERMGLGKAPIRAALIRLAADGLVTIASRQGIVITTATIQDVIELYQMRVALELTIVRQIAGKLTAEQVQRLRANLDAFESLPMAHESVQEVVAADFDFHRQLCEFHGNRQMARVLDRVFDSLYREIRIAQTQFPERLRISADEHRAVAEAIVAGDVDRAEWQMKSHLRFGEEFILSRGSISHRGITMKEEAFHAKQPA
jgi:DNA-binding GntR family transcriptional regulator